MLCGVLMLIFAIRKRSYLVKSYVAEFREDQLPLAITATKMMFH